MNSEQVRDATFQIFEQLDNPLARINMGQQWIVQTKDGTRAILKTAAKGGLIVKTKTSGNDAKIIGFDAGVTHVLAAVVDGQTVTAYMVPIKVVEAAYRRNNREWLEAGSKRKQNTTWVLLFPGDPSKHDYFGHGMATVWMEYAVGSLVLNAIAPIQSVTATLNKDALFEKSQLYIRKSPIQAVKEALNKDSLFKKSQLYIRKSPIQAVKEALNKDALFEKSQSYIRKSLTKKISGDLEEDQLWASLAIELLGKSALANTHPSLVVDPQHWKSLFAASRINISTEIRTINAKTLFNRLTYLIDKFDSKAEDFCNQVTNRRNAELHSGDVPFAAIKAEHWEGEYWHVADIILIHMDSYLGNWLGSDDAETPQEILSTITQAKRKSIKFRVKHMRDNFNKKIKSNAARKRAVNKSRDKSIRDYPRLSSLLDDEIWDSECPSCTSKAFIAGKMVKEEVLGTDGSLEIVERYFNGEKFQCPTCTLSLDGYDELKFANVPPGQLRQVGKSGDDEVQLTSVPIDGRIMEWLIDG